MIFAGICLLLQIAFYCIRLKILENNTNKLFFEDHVSYVKDNLEEIENVCEYRAQTANTIETDVSSVNMDVLQTKFPYSEITQNSVIFYTDYNGYGYSVYLVYNKETEEINNIRMKSLQYISDNIYMYYSSSPYYPLN